MKPLMSRESPAKLLMSEKERVPANQAELQERMP